MKNKGNTAGFGKSGLRGILRQNKAQKCGNTLCISNVCNAILAQKGRNAPQTTPSGVASQKKIDKEENIC